MEEARTLQLLCHGCSASQRAEGQPTTGAAAGKARTQPVRPLPSRGSCLGFAQSLLWVTAESADQCVELFDRGGEPHLLGTTQHQGHAEIAAPELRVGADLEIGVPQL